MRVVVLGAGVIGVAAAWYLAEAGHEVVVLDRRDDAGMETSFANAGQISPGYSAPWAAPGIPLKALRWMVTRHAPFRLYPRADPAMLRWLAMMLGECNEAAYARNKERMVRLAVASRDALRDLRAATGIEYDGGERGLIQLFRDERQFARASRDVALLAESGIEAQLLDGDRCLEFEPGLDRAAIVGGLRLPGDETGDAHLFTRRLAALAAGRGVAFRMGTTIEAILTEGDRIAGVRTDRGMASGDAYVVALGSHGARLLAPIGLRIPVYPLKGYSITLRAPADGAGPRSTVADQTHRVAITRLGDRIRAGGTAELSGYDTTLRPSRRASLEHAVGTLFPGVLDDAARADAKASFWTGLRPATPDGTPIVGAAGRYRNLWLDIGHGTLGWTMACGSGRLIADLVSGRTPNIPHADLSLARYARRGRVVAETA